MTKSELQNLYVEKGMTLQEIATLKGCSYGVVHKWMTKHEIARRPTGFTKGTKFSQKHRQKISESKKGNNHPNFGKKCNHPKRYWYKCPNDEVVSMRSRWEVAYADYLDQKGVQWVYEHRTFTLSTGDAYTPDFYIIEADEYVEVKGWFTETSRAKIDKFRNEFNYKLTILQRAELEELGIDLNKEFTGTKRPRNTCEMCKNKFIRTNKSQRFCGNKCKNKWIANNSNQPNQRQATKRKYNGSQHGDHNNGSKLTESDVYEILEMRENGTTLADIASAKNISIGNVGNIIKGRSWKHIPRNKQ